MAVFETRATANNISLLNISGYRSVFKNRPGGRGGGVPLFIHYGFTYAELDDFNVYNNSNF